MALQDFITHVKQVGMLVGNKFEFIAPSLDNTQPTTSNTVSLLCTSSNLPGITLMSNDIRYYGEITERPTSIIYPAVSLTFYLDNDLSAKRYFEQWISLVFDRESRSLNYYDNFTRDVEIVVYNKAEQEVERIKLYECYPKAIQDVNLDYHNNNVLILNVNLIYKWWSSSQLENWKGNTSKESKPLDDLPTFGSDNLKLGEETMANFTGNTPFGNGTPSSLYGIEDDNDMSSFLQRLGSDINTNSSRGFAAATEYMNFSNIDDSLIQQFQGSYRDLTSSFNEMGNNISLIGGSPQSIVSLVPGLSNSINRVAMQTSYFGNLSNQLGQLQDLGQFSGNIMQMSNTLSSVSHINQLPQYLNSLSSSFNQIGSSINQSSQLLTTNNTVNPATIRSFNSVSSTYFSAGSFLNRAATAIGR